MDFGVCYYPEHWPADRWAVDAAEMRAAGIDIVRIGEFAWARMEPASGAYDWAWLDNVMRILADAGHRLILGTPTATPPAWLTRAQPDILRVERSGRRRDHGSRRHTCPNSPTYRAHSRRIVTALAERYGAHPALIGWQTDNEFGGGHSARCYCDNCATAFRTWLAERYGTIDALNEAWGAVFWSQNYSSFDQVRPPGDAIDKKNPSHELDYFRFCSDSFVSYQREQVEILRRLTPGRFVTHNFMGLFWDLDQFDLAADLDFATWDNYPTGNPERWRRHLYAPDVDQNQNDPIYAYDVGDPLVTSMAHALTRALKQAPFWIMEQQCGQINWGDVNPGVRAGTPRLWAWHAVAEGAEAIVYFRWRATRLAHEQYHSGFLRHDGSHDVAWADQQQLLSEKEQLDSVAAAPFNARIGILFDFADLWSIELQPHRADFDYLRHLYVYYHALHRLGVPVDFVSFGADWSRYDLLLGPTVHLLDEARVARLRDYAAQGGTLLLGVRSGFKTASNLVTAEPLPGALADLVGATVTSWQSLPLSVDWGVESDVPGLSSPATYWVETLAPTTATTLAHYRFGQAALTENTVGQGRVLYLGWYPRTEQAQAIIRRLTEPLGIVRSAVLPNGMIAVPRGDHTVLLNFTDRLQTCHVDGVSVAVPGRDVRVVTRNQA